jgi:hypothetical protein
MDTAIAIGAVGMLETESDLGFEDLTALRGGRQFPPRQA